MTRSCGVTASVRGLRVKSPPVDPISWRHGVMGLSSAFGFLMVAAGSAAADPAPPAPPASVPQASALQLVGIPSPPPPSLRLEAARVAAERFAVDWRYPEPSSFVLRDGGDWFVGYGYYRPRSKRAAALHAGSAVATMVGEILMSANSPLAGVGAMLTGATLDSATADADRDAEAKHR